MVGGISENKIGVLSEDSHPSVISFANIENKNPNNFKNTDSEEDKFISSTNNNPDSICTQNKSAGSCVNHAVELFDNFCERLSGIAGAFSPLLLFAKNLAANNDSSQPQDNGQLIGNFGSLLQSTGVNVAGKHLVSRESQEALDEPASVSQLPQNNNNVNLTIIIVQWRDTRDAQCLLHMAHCIECGECVSLNESELMELRESFIRGLRALAAAIRDAEERGEYHALLYLHDTAEPLVCGVERAHEASQRECTKLTIEDRRFIAEQLQESCNYLERGICNGVFYGLCYSVFNELCNWTSCVYDFLKEFWQQLEKEEKERQEEARREECEERHRLEAKRQYLHAMYKREESKKLMYRALMKRAEMEMLFAMTDIRRSIVNKKNPSFDLCNLMIAQHRFNLAGVMSRIASNSENALIQEENRVEDSMPPESVCDFSTSPVFDFNVHC